MLGVNKIQSAKVLQHPITESNIISRHATKQLDLVTFQLCRFLYLSFRPTLPGTIEVLRAICPFHRWVEVDGATACSSWIDATSVDAWWLCIARDSWFRKKSSIK